MNTTTSHSRRASAPTTRPVLALQTCLLALALSTLADAALAQPADAPAPRPPYSLPWQLRPVAAATVVRSDTALAFYEDPASGQPGSTVASMVLGSYKLTPELAPLVRLGVVHNDAPADPPGTGFNFINPALGGTYALDLSPDFKLALFLGITVPVGGGGGDTPDPGNATANGAGILARSAMDNAMFAVNYLTVFPGLGLAYVNHGVTVQIETTLLQLMRVRGENHPAGADSSRTNLTIGLHVGYFFIPQLSAGADVRHQRWLSTPTSVEANDVLRDTSTFAVGIRGHFKLGDTLWLRPGIAYARGIDDPMDAGSYHIVQLDVPFVF